MALAWRPATRALPLPMLGAAGLLAALPPLVVAARGGQDFTGALVASFLIAGGVFAFAVDDPAAETLSASPTTLARRHALRLAALVVGAAATLTALWLLGAGLGALPASELSQRAAEIAATAGVALAIAGTAQREGTAQAVHLGAVAGPVGVLVMSAFAYRFQQLPAIITPLHHDRWWWVAAGAWAVVAWSWRDPAR